MPLSLHACKCPIGPLISIKVIRVIENKMSYGKIKCGFSNFPCLTIVSLSHHMPFTYLGKKKFKQSNAYPKQTQHETFSHQI